MDTSEQLRNMKSSTLQLDHIIKVNGHYLLEESVDDFQDFDGKVGDFVKAYRLHSKTDPTKILGISIYLDQLNLLVNKKYSFSYQLNRNSSTMIELFRTILNTLSNIGAKETVFFIGKKRLSSRLQLPQELVGTNNNHTAKAGGITFIANRTITQSVKF